MIASAANPPGSAGPPLAAGSPGRVGLVVLAPAAAPVLAAVWADPVPTPGSGPVD
jgi:hypothetical protein